MKPLLPGLAILVFGLLFFLSPPGQSLEENLGLELLYEMRGPRIPPPEVAIIGIDRHSARQLNLPTKPEQWPRSIHTALLNGLAKVAPEVVVMDMVFSQARDIKGDRALAKAIQQAGHVILAELLQKEPLYNPDGSRSQTQPFDIRKSVLPIENIREVSTATAPMPVPKVPIKVSRYWAFVPEAAGKPSLPVVAYQIYAKKAFPALIDVFNDAAHSTGLPPLNRQWPLGRRLEETVLSIRERVQVLEEMSGSVGFNVERSLIREKNIDPLLLRRLVRMYVDPDSRFFNFYGPPGTIQTIAYHQVISRNDQRSPENPWVVADLSAYKNKAVFIGLSERDFPLKTDGFYTVYSQSDGIDLNGVEITATAFANLLEDRPLRPVGFWAAVGIFLICGGLMVLSSRSPNNLMAGSGTLLICAAYVVIAALFFQSKGVWLPVIIIVFIQAPLIFITGVFQRYRRIDAAHQAIRHAFTFYLPDHLVKELAENKKADVTAGGQMAHGALICTDLTKYTSFSEGVDPLLLNQRMHDYFKVLFKPVQENSGIVSDLAGDSMMALWATVSPDLGSRHHACAAAIQMVNDLKSFWKTQPQPIPLATRIGIHYGPIHIGNVGAGNHFEYKATGDTVNTAARIENLNKHLKTQILISAEAMDGIDGFLTRKLGTFLLSGKSQPVTIFELMGHLESVTEQQREAKQIFSRGLSACRNAVWKDALAAFNHLLSFNPTDGPSQFYARLCRKYQKQPPATNWEGIITIGKR